MPDFGVTLGKAMARLGLRQRDLADRIGVSQGYISALISGRKLAPSAKVVASLAVALQVPAAELYAAAGLPKPKLGKPFVLGVCGASGSGKTWFAEKLRQLEPASVCIISQDRYYKPQAQVAALRFGWDEPDALDLKQLAADLTMLSAGEAVQMPTYDYAKHQRGASELVHPAPMLVVEGHLIFHSEELLNLMDETLWVQAEDVQLLSRRLRRDCLERGRTWDDVLRVFEQVVIPANRLYVLPQRARAALELNNNASNPADMPLLAKTLMAYAQAQRLS